MNTANIEFKQVNNSTTGTPRYVCHFTALITDKDEQEIKDTFAASLQLNPLLLTSLKYERALSKVKKLGGKKYHNKNYGGGIAFSVWNTAKLENTLTELLKVAPPAVPCIS